MSAFSSGAISRALGAVALLARLSARTAGRSRVLAGPRMDAMRSTFSSVPVVWRRAPGSFANVAWRLSRSAANWRKTVAEESTSSARSSSLAPSSVLSSLSEVMSRRSSVRRFATWPDTSSMSR